MPLTDIAVRNAKGSERPRKLSDAGGLHLLVTPSGGRLWRLSYRFDGKQRQLALGGYPVVSLADARKARDEAKAVLAAGRDPGVERKLSKLVRAAANAITFNVIADEMLAKARKEHRSEATLGKKTWILEKARADLGTRPIREISAAEILAVLRKVEGAGRLETAARLRATIGQVFRYGIATARVDNDPTVPLRGALVAPKVTSYAAITDPAKLGALLRAIDQYDGQPSTRSALLVMAYVFPRPGELRLATKDEFDLERGIWTIPATHTKMRRPHRSPLSRQAIAVLSEQFAASGSTLVFPSYVSTTRSISENTMNSCLRRMGYSREEMTSHGFRSTASTILNETGKWHPDAIERQLAHTDSNKVRGIYHRGEHWNERVEMLAWWADYLDELRARPAGNL